MFDVVYDGTRYPATMTQGKVYTVYWAKLNHDGTTYFLVGDDFGVFNWVDKSQFKEVPLV